MSTSSTVESTTLILVLILTLVLILVAVLAWRRRRSSRRVSSSWNSCGGLVIAGTPVVTSSLGTSSLIASRLVASRLITATLLITSCLITVIPLLVPTSILVVIPTITTNSELRTIILCTPLSHRHKNGLMIRSTSHGAYSVIPSRQTTVDGRRKKTIAIPIIVDTEEEGESARVWRTVLA